MGNTARKQQTAPQEQLSKDEAIQKRFGITPDMLNRLETGYINIREIAGNPDSKNPLEYERVIRELLGKIKETIELNGKKLPYEVPDLAPGLPLKAATLMYPDFEKEFIKSPQQRKREQEEMKKREKEPSPEYERWLYEEEVRLKVADQRFPAPPRGVEEISRSISDDLDKILGETPIDLDEEVTEETAPAEEREAEEENPQQQAS